MKTGYLILLVWIVGTVGLPGEEASVRVATLEISSNQGQSTAAQDLRALLEADLTVIRGFTLVERERLDAALGEQALGAGGWVTAGQAAAIGRLTGAQLLLGGRLIGGDTEQTLVVRLISVTTGETVAAKVTGEESLFALSESAVGEVSRLVAENRNKLLPAPASELDPLLSLRDELAGLNLPSLSISIPESHIGRIVPDPAAETELARILDGCGFVIGEESRATIHLRGEAFSEGAAAVAGLVSCRARVEVIATLARTGERVFSDAAEGVAVDVAENVAGKRALVDAAQALAPRLARALAASISDSEATAP